MVCENRKIENYQRDLWKIESNSVDRALARAKTRQRNEIQMEMAMQEKVERQKVYQEEYERQRRLAEEMSQIERKKFVEEKMRQQIRESNQELKELESRLKAAYVAKGLAAQLR